MFKRKNKKQEVVEKFTFSGTIKFKDDTIVKFKAGKFERDKDLSDKICDLLEDLNWFYLKTMDDEILIIESKSVKNVTVNREPLKDNDENTI